MDSAHPWYTHPVVRNPDTPNRAGQTGEERFASMFAHPRSAINEARLVREFRRSIGALETHLADHQPREYLAADRFTVADLNGKRRANSPAWSKVIRGSDVSTACVLQSRATWPGRGIWGTRRSSPSPWWVRGWTAAATAGR